MLFICGQSQVADLTSTLVREPPIDVDLKRARSEASPILAPWPVGQDFALAHGFAE